MLKSRLLIMKCKNILIVSGRYPATDFSSAENHRAYANKHGFTYIHCPWPGTTANPYFNKIEYILEYMDKYDYIFWIDDDAFFIDFDFNIAELIPKHPHLITICSSPKHKNIWTYISSGQFLIKSDERTKKFMLDIMKTNLFTVEEWWDESKYGYYTDGDQDAMVYLSLNKYKDIFDIQDSAIFNSRVEELSKYSVNLLHITGTVKKKKKALKQACAILNRDKHLIPVAYTGIVSLRPKKTIQEKIVSQVTKMAKLITLEKETDTFSSKLENVISEISENYELVFNPCVYVLNDSLYIVVRVCSNNVVTSLLYSENKSVINLTKYMNEYGVAKCADPKFFEFNQQLYITFNTGYERSSNNEIYIMKVSNGLEKPYRCYFSGRGKIEKNWSFFSLNKELYCIYGVSPLCILKVDEWKDGSIQLSVAYNYNKLNIKSNYTLGSQPLLWNGKLYIFLHKKIFTAMKRMYIGRILKLDVSLVDGSISVNKGDLLNHFYFHSLKSLAGDKNKLNKNLLSCSYFSSLFENKGSIYAGYGVNDLQAKIRKVSKLK